MRVGLLLMLVDVIPAAIDLGARRVDVAIGSGRRRRMCVYMGIYMIMVLVDFRGVPRVVFWALHSGLSGSQRFGYRGLLLREGGLCRSGGLLGGFGSKF